MASPSHTSRSTPSGNFISEGYEVHFTCSLNPSVEFWEKSIVPPGWDAGDARVVTNQFSGTRVQKAPSSTIEVTDSTVVAHFDPGNIGEIRAMVGKRQTFTYTYPDNTQYSEYGFIKSAIFGELARNTEPLVTLTIVHTSTDPSDCSAADGLITAGTGTVSAC